MSRLIGSIVIPIYSEFLEVLVERRKQFTTLIWPGFGVKANRMVSPHNWLVAGPRRTGQGRQSPQKAVPFLYRGIGDQVEPPHKVSHVGLVVYMVHDNIYAENSAIQEILRRLRVERFSKDEWGDKGVRTWYIVTETLRLDDPIPYDQLWLIRHERYLDPSFSRGYGLVQLPDHLHGWYADCLAKHTDLLGLSSIERWKALPH